MSKRFTGWCLPAVFAIAAMIGATAATAQGDEGMMQDEGMMRDEGMMEDEGAMRGEGMMEQEGMMEEGEMMEEGSMAMGAGGHSQMQMGGSRLDALVAAMEAATGAEKIDAIAAVVRELVSQHKSMHGTMMEKKDG